MTTPAAQPMQTAVTTLVAEGHDRADVIIAAIDSLIDSGIESWGSLTATEMSVVRDQLASQNA